MNLDTRNLAMNSAMHSPYVSVVVPTRARRFYLNNCLESLLALDYPKDRYEIIVVEDGTDEGQEVADDIRLRSPVPIRYTRIPHSGAATARNVGVQLATGDIVAFIDDDGIAVPAWLRRLVQALLKDGVAGVGGRVSPEYPELELEAAMGLGGDLLWSGFNASPKTLQDVDHLPGGNMSFWRSALLEVRGLDTRYTRRGSWREDTDLCVRLRLRGYRLLYDGEAQIIHRAARWMNPWERLRPGLVWAMTRDDAYFRVKNYGWSGVWGTVRSAMASVKARVIQASANLFLISVHLLAWMPGVAKGLRNKNDPFGSLEQK
jgi:cellulose synthase/poly-beta-1,6-N-acetylglucosamine synthase-like glycosyltransferase